MYTFKWSLCWMITWKLLFGEGHLSGVGNAQFILQLDGILSPSKWFPPIVWGKNRRVHTISGWQASKIKGRGTVLVKWGILEGWRGEGIIQRNNSAGHCLVLRDLIPMFFFLNNSWLWNWTYAPQAKFLIKFV